MTIGKSTTPKDELIARGNTDIEFVVQLGLLLSADRFPKVIESTEFNPQLQALRACGWINAHAFRVLEDAYSQLARARLQRSLVNERVTDGATTTLNLAQALCKEILG